MVATRFLSLRDGRERAGKFYITDVSLAGKEQVNTTSLMYLREEQLRGVVPSVPEMFFTLWMEPLFVTSIRFWFELPHSSRILSLLTRNRRSGAYRP